MKELVIASRNKKKAKELAKLLSGLKIKVLSLTGFPRVPRIIEDKKDFKGNAVKKAVISSRFTGRLTLADDSGLEVKALRGAPGVRSARFGGKQGDDARNIEKLLRLLKDTPISGRQARFRCVVAVAYNGKLIGTVEGRCSGRISFFTTGRSGFGYDPVFIPTGYKRSFAELSPATKNRISHRSRAIKRARKLLKNII